MSTQTYLRLPVILYSTLSRGDGDACNGDQATLQIFSVMLLHPNIPQITHKTIVLTAHSIGGASTARANTCNRDRGAGKTDEDVNALDHDPQESQKSTSYRTRDLT